MGAGAEFAETSAIDSVATELLAQRGHLAGKTNKEQLEKELEKLRKSGVRKERSRSRSLSPRSRALARA